MSLMPSFSQECWNSTVMICWYKPRWIQQQILEQSQFLNESKYNKNIYKYIIMKGAKRRWLTKFFCHLVYVRSHCIWVQPLPKHFTLSLNIIIIRYCYDTMRPLPVPQAVDFPHISWIRDDWFHLHH